MDRYVLREMVVPLLIGTGAVVLMLIGNLLFNYAPHFFNYGVPFVAVLQLVFYHTPYLAVLSLPVGTAVAVSLTVNRLARDSEITVMRMAGISLRRLFLPLLLMGFLLSALNFWLNEWVVPPAEKQFYRLRNRIFLLQPVPNLTSNVVIKVSSYIVSIGYAERQGKTVRLRNIHLIEEHGSGSWVLIRAPEGLYQEGQWTLLRPTLHYYDKSGEVWDWKVKDRITLDLRVALQEFFSTPLPEELNMQQLGEQIRQNKRMGLNTRTAEVSYHMKLAVPVACFIFAVCSPVLSLWLARAGSFVGVLLSIVLVFVFWNTLLLFQILGNQGFLPPLLAAWAPNLLFGTGGFYLLWRSE